MKLLVGILLTIYLINSVYCTDYCKLDCDGNTNIGCNNSDKLKSSCPEKAQIYTFNSDDINYILDLHNDLRNAICNGSISGYEPCKQSAKMTWDTELAKLAGMNTRSCKMEHDDCRRRDKYEGPGQNIGSVSLSSDYPEIKDAIHQIVKDMWFKERENADMNDIQKFGSVTNDDGEEIGHFTQMVNANAAALGCGATKYQDDFHNILITCNYESGNLVDSPVYLSSEEGGSGCENGTDKTYSALCKEK